MPNGTDPIQALRCDQRGRQCHRVHPFQSRRPGGACPGLRLYHQEYHRTGQERPGRCGSGPRYHGGLRKGLYVLQQHLLRRLCGPLRQPHRERRVQRGRQGLPAGKELRGASSARHLPPQALPGQILRRHPADGDRKPRRGGRLPRQSEDRGALYPDRGQRIPHGLPGVLRCRHHHQPDQPQLFQPGRRRRCAEPEAAYLCLQLSGRQQYHLPHRQYPAGGRHPDGLPGRQADRQRDRHRLPADHHGGRRL